MIPAQVDQITVDWLNEHLDDDIGTIVEVAIEHIGEGVGILGEVARLTLTYADQHSGPATLIAKCQSIHPENVVISQLMGFYEREVNFYSQVAAKLTVRTPHCYIAEMADGGTPFVLVIEAIEGGSMIDQVVGATL